ncbi:N-acetyltransferase [Candidatus Poribacteria bacterium]|nr:N-acetyltransferase [Candidatus Poribacteria bacterium]
MTQTPQRIDVTIRPKSPGDAQALGDMLESCSEQTYYYFHPYKLTRAAGERVAADGSIYCLVAETPTSAIAGYVWIARDGKVPMLGICVADAYQDQGIGRRLMERIVAEARALGKRGIQLTVMQDNDRARALYESVGFVIDGDPPDPQGPAYHMTLDFG